MLNINKILVTVLICVFVCSISFIVVNLLSVDMCTIKFDGKMNNSFYTAGMGEQLNETEWMVNGSIDGYIKAPCWRMKQVAELERIKLQLIKRLQSCEPDLEMEVDE